MASNKKKLGTAAAIIAAVAALTAVITHFSGSNPVSGAVKTVFSPFRSGASFIAGSIESRINFIREAAAYKTENDRLASELTELKKKTREIASYQEENDRLNELLDLRESMTEYSTVAASVIGYSSSRWYDTLELNKGTLAGVEKGNTVIVKSGVVGTVTETGPNWSIVETIINPSSATGIKVARTGDIGVVEGDSELCRKIYCKLSFVDKGASIIVGDILETSGSGGIYPPGLNIGKIREIYADNMGTLNYAIVEPETDFKNLHEVLIINGVRQ